MDRAEAEVFRLLCQLTSGEANTLVRTVVERNGYVAWRKLYENYNPRTPARALNAMLEVMKPPKVKDARGRAKAIEEWEMKIGLLGKDFGEELSDVMKLALLVSMVPNDIKT